MKKHPIELIRQRIADFSEGYRAGYEHGLEGEASQVDDAWAISKASAELQGDAQVASQSPAHQADRRIAQRRSEANTPRSESGPERRNFIDRRVAAAPSPPRAQDWQPITTAPKDGTRIKLKRIYERAVIAEGAGYFGTVTIHYGGGPYMALDGLAYADPSERTYTDVWIAADGTRLFPEPTHWMPDDHGRASF